MWEMGIGKMVEEQLEEILSNLPVLAPGVWVRVEELPGGGWRIEWKKVQRSVELAILPDGTRWVRYAGPLKCGTEGVQGLEARLKWLVDSN
jgi:hypothetical protein